MKIIAMFEDEDDKHLVGQIGRALKLPEIQKEPISLNGYDAKKLLKKLDIVLREDHDRLILVLDADHAPVGGPAKRWKEVLAALRSAGISIPDVVSTENGLIHDLTDGRRISVWLFPDCHSEGALEDFLLQTLVPEGDALLLHAIRAVSTLPEYRFLAKYAHKAEVRTWLAWQKRPGLPPGRAIVEKVLAVDEARLGTFASWLRNALT